ncbi:MAG TPA: DNA/RNA nuclease SfsA [Syntrophorhabdaceae bacterium]|nr:DNA/RNA nuclease SfsA [Syntrophorhabdaceae bacterium]HQE80976.1 DNA/RNA nuclease SfsA [Syntrophorhabdaceae bacterium]HQH44258.1 DNA/RNA nuclease SfsA [Syntrophorhabdaceae bacterium]HQK47343.1 DNA/RNA nuclease SfsA [Syntrophorhabdaceae bacterium]
MAYSDKISIFTGFDTGFFKRRLNRFLVQCECKGRVVTAHLPNPGRLWELLQEGATVYLKENHNDNRATAYTLIAVRKDSRPVFLHTHHTNTIAGILINEGLIPGLEGFIVEKPEFTIDNSRFDFMLKNGDKRMLLEVKSCTLFHNNIAMFPDAVTTRGKRHILGLSNPHYPGGVLFIVHSSTPQYFLPEYHVDLDFSKALYSMKDEIFIGAVALTWEDDLTVHKKVKPLDIPWNIFEKEGKDCGSYMLIMTLNREKIIPIGGLGDISFKKGFYIYVGSAMKNLHARLERHKRIHKKPFWHIDYLREEVDLIHTIPIRSQKRLECLISDSLKDIACDYIPNFGASDCRCNSHLFFMDDNPIHNPDFNKILLDYRMPYITYGYKKNLKDV